MKDKSQTKSTNSLPKINEISKPITKIKTRNNEYRKQRKEERALKFLEDGETKAVAAPYKKGFNHVSGSAQGRKYTVSIAVPGSILNNAISLESKSLLVGQIARSAAVFGVDEIVVYDEEGQLPVIEKSDGTSEIDQSSCINELLDSDDDFNPTIFMAYLLKFLETPPYLRQSLFPKHESLSNVASLPPLAIPSHLRMQDHFAYREAVVITDPEDPIDNIKDTSCVVDAGLQEPIKIKRPMDVDSRVTVQMGRFNTDACVDKSLTYDITDRDEPRIKKGAYWGYRVRVANCISGVIEKPIGFNDSCGEKPSDCRYDCIIGTSEVGTNVDKYDMPKFSHLLIVFGGTKGIEHAISVDSGLDKESDPKKIFQAYLNTCPTQGSRTILTEESIPISLTQFRLAIAKKGRK